MATQTPLPTDEPIIVEIESLLLDGRGVGHIEGKAVFVAGALPGETVSIGFTRRKRKLDEAVVEEVITPSEQRVEPRCSIFGTCGACSLQHFDADAQIREKQQILLDNLERIGHVTPQDVIEPLTSETWGYRQKARLSVRNVHKKGKVLVGFREKKSRYVAETERCEVLDPRVGQKIPQLAALIASLSIVNDVPQIEVASADDNVALVFRVMSPPTDDDIALLVAFAGEHGYQIYLQRKGPDVLEPIGDAPEFLTYTLPDHDVSIEFTATDFTQVNGKLNRKMINRAIEKLAVQSGDDILELFCGLGNFSLPIARQVNSLVGIEGAESLVARAKQNALRNGIGNTEYFTCDLTGDRHNEAWMGRKYHKVFLDPPRTGALEVMPWLGKLKPERIVYVSCNPATLARDAGILVNELGYTLTEAGVMDMFPHTAHVESIAVFVR